MIQGADNMLKSTDDDHTMPFDLSIPKLYTEIPMHLFIETQLCIYELHWVSTKV